MAGSGSLPRPTPWLAMVMGSLYVAMGGVLAVLLPAQVERIDPDGKVGSLAIVTSVAFAVTLFSQPLIGAASDRTFARIGGRWPWMLGGALIGGAAVASLGWVHSILALAVLWAIGQFALNGVDITASTGVVDEFERGRRGRPSGVLAASVAVGAGVGAVLAGLLTATPPLAFGALAAIAVAGSVAFVVGRRAPRASVVVASAPPRSRLQADFVWAIAARFAFTLGQQAVSTYLLYILSDHVGVSARSAPLLVSMLTGTGLVGLLLAAVIAGRWSDRTGRRRPLLVAASVIFTVGMLLPIFAPVLPVMFVYAFVQGAALGMHLAVGGALIAEVLPGADRRPGRDLGLANTVVNAAQAAAPLAAGAVVLATGGYVALFLFAIAAAVLSALAALRVRGVR